MNTYIYNREIFLNLLHSENHHRNWLVIKQN